MNPPFPPVEPANYHTAVDRRCDLFHERPGDELLWMRVQQGMFTIEDHRGHIYAGGDPGNVPPALFLGRISNHTLLLEDCFMLNEIDLSGASYRDRYAILQTVRTTLPGIASIARIYPILEFGPAWASTPVVFRSKNSRAADPIYYSPTPPTTSQTSSIDGRG